MSKDYRAEADTYERGADGFRSTHPVAERTRRPNRGGQATARTPHQSPSLTSFSYSTYEPSRGCRYPTHQTAPRVPGDETHSRCRSPEVPDAYERIWDRRIRTVYCATSARIHSACVLLQRPSTMTLHRITSRRRHVWCSMTYSEGLRT